MKRVCVVLGVAIFAAGAIGCGGPSSTTESSSESAAAETTAQDAALQDCASKWNPRLDASYEVGTPVYVFKWPAGECGLEFLISGSFDDVLSLRIYRGSSYQPAAGGIAPGDLSTINSEASSGSNATVGSGEIVPDDGASIGSVSVPPAS